MKNKTGKLKWIMIIVFLILISVTIIPTTSYTAETKEPTTLPKGFELEPVLDWSAVKKPAKPSQLHLEPIEKQEETTIHFEPIEKSRQSKWRIIATGLAVKHTRINNYNNT